MTGLEDNTIYIDNWETPTTKYPDETLGNVRIKTIHYTRGYYHNYGLKGKLFFYIRKKCPIKTLQIKENGKWRTWMVDDPPHYFSIAEKCHGNVLVGGLGLGLIVHTLLKNINVKKITIIELNQDVIDLISKHLPKDKRIEIIKEDFYDFIGKDKKKRDSIIVDLWVSNSLEETKDVMFSQFSTYRFLKEKYGDIPIFFHGFAQSLTDMYNDVKSIENQFLPIEGKQNKLLRKLQQMGCEVKS